MAVPLPTLHPDSDRSVVLAGQSLSDDVRNAITAGPTVEWPIDAAPSVTVTVADPQGVLRRSPLLARSTTLHVDTIPFDLAAVSKSGTDITLTFEHSVVAALRRHTGPAQAAAGTVSRVDFARQLVAEEPWIEVVVPFAALGEGPASEALSRGDVNAASTSAVYNTDTQGLPPAVMDSGSDPSTTVDTGALALGSVGPADGGPIGSATGPQTVATFGGTLPSSGPLTDAQAATALIRAGWPTNNDLLQTMVAIGHAESSLRIDAVSPPNSDGTIDRGWLQVNSIHGYDAQQLITDPVYCAHAALAIYTGQGLEAWTTYNSGAYRQYLTAAASGVIDAASGDPGLTGSASTGKPEDTWACLQRIFEAVHWRVFVRGVNEVWLTPDWALYQAGPKFTQVDTSADQSALPGDPSIGGGGSSGPFTDQTPGVDTIDFTWDAGQASASASMTCRAQAWSLWPGMACGLSDLGPASGTWLVSRFTRDLSAMSATVEFILPRPSLPEPPNQPAADTSLTDPTGGTGDGTDATLQTEDPSAFVGMLGPQRTQDPSAFIGMTARFPGGPVDRLIAFMRSHLGDAYVWGATGPSSWDCSGLVQAAAASVGVKLPRNSEAMFNAAAKAHRTLSVARAQQIPGTMLFRRAGTTGRDDGGHVAVSLGGNRNIAALNPQMGVTITDDGSQFNAAAYIPGLDYPASITSR